MSHPAKPVCLHCVIIAHVEALKLAPGYKHGDVRTAIDEIAGALAQLGLMCGDKQEEFWTDFKASYRRWEKLMGAGLLHRAAAYAPPPDRRQ